MAEFRFKFPPEAHEAYGADWYELDFKALEHDIDSGVLERFEDETGIMVLVELPDLLARGSFRALRAAMWLTLLIAGRRIKWIAFKADGRTDPRLVEFDATADPEDEQSVPPSNRAQRRAAAKAAPRLSAS